MGLRVGKDGLYDIVGYLEDAFVLRCLRNAASPGGARKAYLVDKGYYRPFLDRGRDYGKLWENAPLASLLRRGDKPSYWRCDRGEIDFVLPEAYIQAPFDLAANSLGDRERLILSPDNPPAWL